MSERLIQILVPADRAERLREIVSQAEDVTAWHDGSDGACLLTIQVPAKEVEAVLDPVQSAMGAVEGFHAFVMPVEAVLPEKKEPTPDPAVDATQEKPKRSPSRVSREELYADLNEQTILDRNYVIMVILSTIVAAVGLSRDNTAAIIGAMVMAPLLGPNMALALATTLGDTALSARALRTNGCGILLAAALAFAGGFVLHVDPSLPEIASRTVVDTTDLLVALAAGIAGALAFTAGVPASLVGVMVAVALLPPLVVCAMLLAGGHLQESFGALLLLMTNVIAVNLAGVGTFLFQGVSPRTWWDAERSKRMTRRSLRLWVTLLIVVVTLIWLSNFSHP